MNLAEMTDALMKRELALVECQRAREALIERYEREPSDRVAADIWEIDQRIVEIEQGLGPLRFLLAQQGVVASG